ncbi:MAG TPA: condensation domain-containing protein, partial [Puia sp.]|nr:condensation domain-containing protein [Puia sp.]
EEWPAFLSRVNQEFLKSIEFQQYPFDLLLNEVRPRTEASRNGYFDVFLLLQNYERDEAAPAFADLELRQVELDIPISQFDISFIFRESADRLSLKVEYNTELYKLQTVEGLSGELMELLRELSQSRVQAIRDLELFRSIHKGENSGGFLQKPSEHAANF